MPLYLDGKHFLYSWLDHKCTILLSAFPVLAAFHYAHDELQQYIIHNEALRRLLQAGLASATSIGLTKQKMQSLTTMLAAYKLGLKIQMHNKYCKRDRHNNKLHAMAMRGTVYHQSFAVCV